eukprot:2344275-Lingulodinium_polyedra.AAC.1
MTAQGEGLIRWIGATELSTRGRRPTPTITVALANTELPFHYVGPTRHCEVSVGRATQRRLSWASEQ